MTERIWHSGKPPCVGWYNASKQRQANCWRWWDGQFWSLPAYENEKSDLAIQSAFAKAEFQDCIEWTTYWPKNPRVPDTRNLKGYK